jgi:hypothetical protein
MLEPRIMAIKSTFDTENLDPSLNLDFMHPTAATQVRNADCPTTTDRAEEMALMIYDEQLVEQERTVGVMAMLVDDEGPVEQEGAVEAIAMQVDHERLIEQEKAVEVMAIPVEHEGVVEQEGAVEAMGMCVDDDGLVEQEQAVEAILVDDEGLVEQRGAVAIDTEYLDLARTLQSLGHDRVQQMVFSYFITSQL